MNRLTATLAIMGLFIVGLIVLIFLTAPIIVAELADFVENFPRYVGQLQALATDPGRPWLRKIVGEGLGSAEQSIDELRSLAADWLAVTLRSAWSGGQALVSVFSLCVVTPIVTCYLVNAWNRMIAVIDNWVPPVHRDTVRALARDTLESVRLDLGPNPSSGIAVEETSAYDPVQQVRLLTWRVREPKVGVREVAPFRLRQIFPQEVPLLLEPSGLELAARHGDFAGNPLTGQSLNQVRLARAPATSPAIRSRVKAWPAPLRRRHASCRRLMRWRHRLRS